MLVTGASGFLGRNLVDRLRQLGCDVVPIGRAQGFDLLTDRLALDGVRHVFHLAGETGVLDAWSDPSRFHLVNAHGTVRVLEQCREADVSLTYVGAYIYGIPERLPIDESHPVRPNNPYAFSKWMGEEACRWYASTYDMSITAIRLFNVYGPGQSNRFLITRIVDQLMDPAVESIELMDLAPRRDYLFVDDAIDAFVAAMPERGFRVLNVGQGQSWSVSEVVRIAMDVLGVQKPVVDKGNARPNEIPDVVADCSAMRDYCGWMPRRDLQTGIATWLKESVG
ncbi:NAD(P)-dependent oxidoreductase [Luteibacter sp. UNC138MFCol5.1]|uniref:NAD-dependent epimerase/dehydratase family protein n=1 Tax=Luteibacter sp. UNC138MFCol5.1 TaxID=1502774 RepID=UPI0015A61376|nr:NAD(P)-dependent oxidoreductase [Luteibacter sp. UNC138MFCol5.1]